jgi:hypothetical protein
MTSGARSSTPQGCAGKAAARDRPHDEIASNQHYTDVAVIYKHACALGCIGDRL